MLEGDEKKGMKTMFGKGVSNCVKKEEIIREEQKKYLLGNNQADEII